MFYNTKKELNKTCYLSDVKTSSDDCYECNKSSYCSDQSSQSCSQSSQASQECSQSCRNSFIQSSNECNYKIKKKIKECDKTYSRSERIGTIVDMLNYLSRPLSNHIEKLSYIPLPEFQIRNSSILNIIENNYEFKIRNEIDLLENDTLQINIELPKIIYNFYLGDEILEPGLIKINLAIKNHHGYKWFDCTVNTIKQGCGAFLITATLKVDDNLDCVDGFKYNIGFTKLLRVYKHWSDKKENNMKPCKKYPYKANAYLTLLAI